MSKGRVTWYSETLGYGFIETGTGDRVLVRSTALDLESAGSLQEGDEVEFRVRSTPDGVIEAKSVTPLDRARSSTV